MNELMDRLQLEEAARELVDVFRPLEEVKLIQSTKKVVTRGGGVYRDRVIPLLPIMTCRWAPSDTDPQYLPQVSRVVRLSAYAAVAPTTGTGALITLQVLPPGDSLKTIGTLSIPKVQKFQETAFQYDTAAGSLLFATLTTAAGATGVTIFASYKLI